MASSAAPAGATSPTSWRAAPPAPCPPSELADIHAALVRAWQAGESARARQLYSRIAAAAEFPGGVPHGDDQGSAAPPRRARRMSSCAARAPGSTQATSGSSSLLLAEAPTCPIPCRYGAGLSMANVARCHRLASRRFIVSHSARRALSRAAAGRRSASTPRGYLVRKGNRTDLSRHRHVGARQGHRRERHGRLGRVATASSRPRRPRRSSTTCCARCHRPRPRRRRGHP